MTRDWTPSDQADAAESQRSRQWWKSNPYDDPDYRANEPDEIEDLLAQRELEQP